MRPSQVRLCLVASLFLPFGMGQAQSTFTVSPANQPTASDSSKTLGLYSVMNLRLAGAMQGAESSCLREYAVYQGCSAIGFLSSCGAAPTCSFTAPIPQIDMTGIEVKTTGDQTAAVLVPKLPDSLPGVAGMSGMPPDDTGVHAPTKIPKEITMVREDPAPPPPASSIAASESPAPPIRVNPPHPTGPARLSGGVMAGAILNMVQPTYPPIAKAAHVGGTVVMHAIISKDGTIEKLEAISGPDMLKGAALDAVKQWTYKPYLLNGEPCEVDTTITVNFNLNDPAQSAAPAYGPPSTGVAGMSGGAPGGIMGGVPGGTMGSGQPMNSVPSSGPIRIQAGVMSGQILYKVAPTYPAIAKAAHVGGTVVLHAIISRQGTIANLEAISGPDMLKAAAMDAVRQWVYKPYLLNGEPTEVDTTVYVNFNMNSN